MPSLLSQARALELGLSQAGLGGLWGSRNALFCQREEGTERGGGRPEATQHTVADPGCRWGPDPNCRFSSQPCCPSPVPCLECRGHTQVPCVGKTGHMHQAPLPHRDEGRKGSSPAAPPRREPHAFRSPHGGAEEKGRASPCCLGRHGPALTTAETTSRNNPTPGMAAAERAGTVHKEEERVA